MIEITQGWDFFTRPVFCFVFVDGTLFRLDILLQFLPFPYLNIFNVKMKLHCLWISMQCMAYAVLELTKSEIHLQLS